VAISGRVVCYEWPLVVVLFAISGYQLLLVVVLICD